MEAVCSFFILLAFFGGCFVGNTVMENRVISTKPFKLDYEYQCTMTEKGKKQQALEKELAELK